jgi:hypothetical protein
VRAVNLLPRDAERTRSDGGRAPLLVLVGGLAAVTATTIFLYFSAAGTVSERRGDLEAAREAVAAATPSSPVAPPEGLVVQERADRVAALAAALSSRVPLDVLLRQIAYVLPTDAWLTGLQASSAADTIPTPASGASGGSPPATTTTGSSGTSLTIDGATFTQEGVARVLARLAVLPALGDVQLTKSERVVPQSSASGTGGGNSKPKSKAKKQRAIVTFSISATYSRGAS